MSFLRQSAVPVLLAVFGTVSLLGTGLHLLPGCGHSHFCSSGSCCDHHDEGCHDHAPPDERGAGKSASDCAICRLLALPRVLVAPPAIVEAGGVVDWYAAALPVRPALELPRPYGARAPPRSVNA